MKVAEDYGGEISASKIDERHREIARKHASEPGFDRVHKELVQSKAPLTLYKRGRPISPK